MAVADTTWVKATLPAEDVARTFRAAYLSGLIDRRALAELVRGVSGPIHISQRRLFAFKSGLTDTRA